MAGGCSFTICLLRIVENPPCPVPGRLDSHNRWIKFWGAGECASVTRAVFGYSERVNIDDAVSLVALGDACDGELAVENPRQSGRNAEQRSRSRQTRRNRIPALSSLFLQFTKPLRRGAEPLCVSVSRS
jgi:hypothetical protein